MSVKAHKVRRKDRGPRRRRGGRAPGLAVVLMAVVSLVLLFGPFSGEVLAAAPALAFLAAFALFMVPGLLISFALPVPGFDGPARIPLAFVLSAGVFGLAAPPTLLLSNSLTVYLAVCGVILAISLGLAVLGIVRGGIPAGDEGRYAVDLSTGLLWVPFSLLTGLLALFAGLGAPRPGEDTWTYMAFTRELLDLGRLNAGGFSRLLVNGWLPEQTALSAASGLDPVDMVLRYLGPTLVVVAMLALYALARVLLQNEKAALVIGSLSALFFLVSFGSLFFESVLAPTGEFVDRITEDKYVARYLCLPVAVSLAVVFVRHRSLRNLGLFFFACISAALVHPLGLIFVGVCVGGFGLVHLAIERRDRGAWLGIGGLSLVLLAMVVPPTLYLLATGSPLVSKLGATDTDVASSLIGTWQYEQRLLQLGDGSFIAHPSLLLDPAMLAAYVLGVPFLVWKARSTLAARLLLGVLVIVPVLIFVPFIATPFSDAAGPWILHRLAWPLLLVALLVLGWICWEALRLAGVALSSSDLTRGVAPFAALIFVGLLFINAVPLMLTGYRVKDTAGETAQGETTCQDPVFRWMRSAIPDPGTIVAQVPEGSCIKAYMASADVLGVRAKVPPRAQSDLKSFFDAPALDHDALQVLERRGTSHVMLPVNSPLNAQLEHLPGLTRMDNPGDRYRVYEVDRGALETTPAVAANGYFNEQDWDAAIEGYSEALNEDDPDDRFLAYLGQGRAYAAKDLQEEAAQSYESAIQLDPESPAAHLLLANARSASGDTQGARDEYGKAVDLDPDNADLRLGYGRFLVPLDKQASVEQHAAVVDRFPNVPEYRVKLGTALTYAGDPEAGDAQYARAVYLAPLSATLQSDIGNAKEATGRPAEAVRYYERALAREPNSQLYALQLGKVHALLAARGGGGDQEEHFEEAVKLLTSVDDRGHLPWEPDRREAAHVALGDLYAQRDRPEDAASEYEEAIALNPDSEEAQNKLDGLSR